MLHVSLVRRSIKLRVKKVTGLSMLEILHKGRIEHAKALLTHKDGTISTVAATLQPDLYPIGQKVLALSVGAANRGCLLYE